MIPFYILTVYLFGRVILCPTEELYTSLKFNGMAGMFLIAQYVLPSFYGWFMTTMTAYGIYLLLSGSQTSSYVSYLLLALAHGIFHDEFMIQENILLNVTVDDLLHGIMFLLVADSYKNRKISITLSIMGVINVLIAFLSLDLKYTHKCDELIFGLSAPQPLTTGCAYWFGGYGGVSTVIMAVGAISGLICIQLHPHLSPDILFLEMLPYFFATTAMYFVTDPMWVTALYDEIKYDQLYFVLPVVYHCILSTSQVTKQIKIATDTSVALM